MQLMMFLVFVCVGTFPAVISGPGVKVVVEEDRDAVLPCSLSTEESIIAKVFDWRKDESQKEVFFYDSGLHYNNGRIGQDEQFRGRVSHYEDQLMNGNASIKIHNTKVADSGIYSCILPKLQPIQTFYVELVVGPGVKVVVEEDRDAVLPCSLSTEENSTAKVFDWRKDESQKEVFFYDSGIHYNNGRIGQDEQFRGRVSHYEDQLMNGNASIKIHNTKVADSGIYRCILPKLEPIQTFDVELVVERLLRDRSGEIPGASKPSITVLDATKDWSLLQCEVHRASPEPKVQLQDGSGNILPAEERRGRYYVTLNITVTKTDRYLCVLTQEEISHQSRAETFVFISGAGNTTDRNVAVGIGVVAVVVVVVVAVVAVVVVLVVLLKLRQINL
ncbi:programmed cell death 1 ligand 1-like [Acanthopagrus schlegelii]